MIKSNWNDVKQGIIDAMADRVKEFKKDAEEDINNRINSKGIKSVVGKNGVEFTASDVTEYKNGKVYFDDVFKDISNQAWIDSI